MTTEPSNDERAGEMTRRHEMLRGDQEITATVASWVRGEGPARRPAARAAPGWGRPAYGRWGHPFVRSHLVLRGFPGRPPDPRAGPAAEEAAPMTSSATAVRPRPVREASSRARRGVEWYRYFLFGRVLPTAFFGLSAALVLATSVVPAIDRALADPGYTNIAHAVQATTYLLFAILPAALYLTRPAPRARDGSLPARAAGFLAITYVLVIPIIIPVGSDLYRSAVLDATIGVVLTVGAWAFAIVTLLFLRHNVSVIPEARSLVTSGPYRVVRHPLYLAEIVATAGALFGELRVRSLVALGVGIGLQIIRTIYEERLLSRVFPEYAAYATRTKRLVPRIW